MTATLHFINVIYETNYQEVSQAWNKRFSHNLTSYFDVITCDFQ